MSKKMLYDGRNLLVLCCRDLQLSGLSRLERDPQWVVPHFDSKGDIEAYMVAIGLPGTYLR
jgi:hypothetical protein